MQPIVSVIIPTYNRAQYLIQAVHSVLEQTRSDYEIIVVDDGSTDNTSESLKPLIEKDKILYVKQLNKGVSAARNHGIKFARGKYIAFLDDDDLWLPHKLELQIACMEQHPEAGLVHSSFAKFEDLTSQYLGVRNTAWYSGWLYPRILNQWNDLMAIDAIMFPMKVFQKIGNFDERIRQGEDLELYWRISRYYPFVRMPEILTKVRVHAHNYSGNRANASAAFRICLEVAFRADPDLPILFRRKALARMYSFMGYNQLGESSTKQLQTIWRDCWNAIAAWPFELNAYICLIISVIPVQLRQLLLVFWRNVRYQNIHID